MYDVGDALASDADADAAAVEDDADAAAADASDVSELRPGLPTPLSPVTKRNSVKLGKAGKTGSGKRTTRRRMQMSREKCPRFA